MKLCGVMKTFSSVEIKKSLLKKGFKYADGDHKRLWLYDEDGNQLKVHTLLSHSKKDYSNYLLGAMKRQLHFDNSLQMEKFIKCSVNYQDYLQILREKEIIIK
jgi:hypothetical protein